MIVLALAESRALTKIIDEAQKAEAALRVSGYQITANSLSLAVHDLRLAFKEVL